MATGFFNAIAQILSNNKVPAPIQQARQNICNACPERITLTNQCGKCGCFLSMKTEIKTEHCPLYKWNVYV